METFFSFSVKQKKEKKKKKEEKTKEKKKKGDKESALEKKGKKTPLQAIAILDLLRLRLLRPIVILNGSPPGAVPVTAVVVGCVSTTPRGAEAAPPGAWTRPSLPTPPLDD